MNVLKKLPADTLSSDQNMGDLSESYRSKPRISTHLLHGIVFLLLTVVGGAGIGFGWRNDSFAWVGILGIGLFLAGQLGYKKFWPCLVSALLAGYVCFWIANPWMQWTVEGLMVDAPVAKATLVVHGIHVLHGGMLVLFAVIWWAARKYIQFGWMLAPPIWLICEAIYPGMFPLRQGCLIADWEPMTQIASVFGIAGVSFQVLLLASLVPLTFIAIRGSTKEVAVQSARRCLIGVCLLTGANFCFGFYYAQTINAEEMNFAGEQLDVALIQGDTEYSTFHREMLNRTRELPTETDLVLWPECSLGHYSRSLTEFSDDAQVSIHSIGIGSSFRPFPNPSCHLLGSGYSWTRETEDSPLSSKFASAYLLDRKESMVGRYDKVELMAGGEYVPGDTWFPALADFLIEEDDEDSIRLSRGLEAKPIGEVNGMSIGVMLCCEDMYPELARDMTMRGADLLATLANGMAFDSEIALQQHFVIGRFRAIENNRYFVRCGSYGISGLISPTGRILKSAPCFEEVDLELQVPIQNRRLTFFTQWGDTLTYASVLLLVLGFAQTVFTRRSEQAV